MNARPFQKLQPGGPVVVYSEPLVNHKQIPFSVGIQTAQKTGSIQEE